MNSFEHDDEYRKHCIQVKSGNGSFTFVASFSAVIRCPDASLCTISIENRMKKLRKYCFFIGK